MKDDPARVPFRSTVFARCPMRTWLALLLLGSVGILAGCSDKHKEPRNGARYEGFDAKTESREKASAPKRPAPRGGQGNPSWSTETRKTEEKSDERPTAPGLPGAIPEKRDSAKGKALGGRPGLPTTTPSTSTGQDAHQPGASAKPVAPKENPKPKTPAVWHRDASRPTFARVYVGDKNSLELVSLHVSVIIEGPRARTLVDHVFRNPHDRQLEGTFEYPLPAGASPSYYAMFLGATRDAQPQRFRPPVPMPGKKPVAPELLAPAELARQIDTADWGKLQEAKIVSQERGLEVYEEVTRRRIDPALLEYASGNTFRGRVFPIAPRGYNRVILAYEETLPVSDARMFYRFALPTCQLHEMRFTIQADARACKDAAFEPKGARKEEGDDRIAFSQTGPTRRRKARSSFLPRPSIPPSRRPAAGTRPAGRFTSMLDFAPTWRRYPRKSRSPSTRSFCSTPASARTPTASPCR